MNTTKSFIKIFDLKKFLLLIILLFAFSTNSDAQLYYNTGISLSGNSNSYLTATPNTLNLTGEFALEAWIFPTSNSSSCIIRKGAAQAYYGVSINSNKLVFLVNNQIRVQSISTIPLNKWTHFTVSFNGDNFFRMYINGIIDNTDIEIGQSPLPNTDSLYIGKKGTELVAHPFQGYLDEIRIWNRLIFPDEIVNNMRTSLRFAITGKYEGLIASYSFQSDNPIPFITIFHDYALNSNHLSAHNVTPVDFTNMPLRNLSNNEALKLDGDGDYISLVNSPSSAPTEKMTLEAWVYPEHRTSNMAILGKGTTESYYLGLTVDKNVVFAPRGFPGYVLGNKKIPEYQWTHIAATYESGMSKIYVNGVLDNSSAAITGTIPATYEPLLIGATMFEHYADIFFEGYLDAVRVSDFIKTQEQIKDFMYQSIDQVNRFDINANELSFNFDGHGSSSTIIANDVAIFKGDAKFSSPGSKNNVPVSPVNRLSNVDFSNDWFMKTSINRRIPATGTIGNMTTDSLYVSSGNSIGGLKLFVALNHTKVSDLEIILTSPSGDSVKVYDNQLLPQTENEIVTVFDDAAVLPLGNNYPCISFGPTVQPGSDLTALHGVMEGYWTLKVRDTKSSDTGRFYAWGIYYDALLPVELASLTASVHSNDVTLNWTTASEINNSGFEIERLSLQNGQTNGTWTKIDFVNGNGSSSNSHNYSYTDKNLSTGSYNYRIKQVDFNGNFEYFDLANEVSIGIPVKYELLQNYPNPFNPVTKINFSLPNDSKVTLQIFDMTGRLIQTLINNESMSAGFHSEQFSGANTSSGIYFYKLSAENFVMTKRMTLVK